MAVAGVTPVGGSVGHAGSVDIRGNSSPVTWITRTVKFVSQASIGEGLLSRVTRRFRSAAYRGISKAGADPQNRYLLPFQKITDNL
jgi:hypothetical protein